MASVLKKGGRLYVLATLPIKDGSPGRKQYKLALHLADTPTNRSRAKLRCRQLEKDLAEDAFDWANWIDDQKTTVRWRDGIERLHHHRVIVQGGTSQDGWDRFYEPRFLVNRSAPLTMTGIEELLAKWNRDTATYVKIHGYCKEISRLTGVPFPEVPSPTYSGPDQILNVPSDPEIEEWIWSAEQPYRWYFGMAATYGLRPHEIEGTQIIDGDLAQVPIKTKTGSRTVIPLHPEWVDQFDLHARFHRPLARQRCSTWLNHKREAMGLLWTPYSLRHAYAGRLWRLGGSELDIFAAARMMGHSVDVHLKTYRDWINPHTIAETARSAIQRNRQRLTQQLTKAISHEG